jgi:RND family efflux transporter MFP subunit
MTTDCDDPTKGASTRRTLRVARATALAAALGLAAWFGVRVKMAHSARAAERDVGATSAAAAPAPGLKVVHPSKETWHPMVRVEGSLAPAREADLGFRAGGRLGAVRVGFGAKVRAGEVLALLDVDEAAARLAVAEAEVRAAEARFRSARDAQARTGRLVAAGAQPAAAGVQADGQRELAEAQVAAAKAQRALAEASLRSHAIAAPFAGTISRVPDGEGSVVAPGVAQFHLQDLSTLKLSGTVSEAEARLVEPGARVELQVGTRILVGEVTAVLPAADVKTRRVPIEARFPHGGDGAALAGTYATAQIRSRRPVEVLRVPATALRPGSQDEVMCVVGGKLEARRIAFVTAPDGALLVRSGLDSTDEVADGPAPEARTGDPVRLANAALPLESEVVR